MDGTDAPEQVDWFGNPIRADGGRPVDPVPCPQCPERFQSSAAFKEHLVLAHGVAPARRRPPTDRLARLRRWGHSQRFLSPWFFLPANATFTIILWQVWGNDLALFSVDDPGAVVRTWAIRLSVLPAVILLAKRVAG